MSSEIESTFREWTRLNLCLEIHQLRADNARLNSELSQLCGSEPCDECGVDTLSLLKERDKLTEVVKACEVALLASNDELENYTTWIRKATKKPLNKAAEVTIINDTALALIHTLQSET